MVSLSLQRLLCNNFFTIKNFCSFLAIKFPTYLEEKCIFTFKTRVEASNNVQNRKPSG